MSLISGDCPYEQALIRASYHLQFVDLVLFLNKSSRKPRYAQITRQQMLNLLQQQRELIVHSKRSDGASSFIQWPPRFQH